MDGALEVLAVFDKPDPLDGPFFEETIYVTPSRLPAPVLAAMETAVAAAAVARSGSSDGPVHAELRVGPPGQLPSWRWRPAPSAGCARALVSGPG